MCDTLGNESSKSHTPSLSFSKFCRQNFKKNKKKLEKNYKRLRTKKTKRKYIKKIKLYLS